MSKDRVRPSPEEYREARQVINEGLDVSRKSLPKSEPVQVSLEWIKDDFVLQKMGGSTGRAISYNQMIISFNTGPEDWKTNLKATVVHEYAHTWLYEKKGRLSWQDYTKMWEFFLQDAHAMNFVEQVNPELPEPMRHHIPKDEIKELWPEIKKELQKDIDWESSLMYGGSKFPRWTGYSTAYLIGKELMKNHGINEFHEITFEDMIKTGDKLFKDKK